MRTARPCGSGLTRALLSLSILVTTAPAWAQDDLYDEEPTPAKPGAVSAEQLFFEGRDLYVAKSYEEALERFQSSFAMKPSPNSHLFVARCRRELGDYAEAYEIYGEVMVEAGTEQKYAKTREAADAERSALDDKIGRVVIVLPPSESATVTMNGKPVASSALGRPLVVNAGEVSVQADRGQGEPFEWSGAVAAGQTTRVDVGFGAGGGDGDGDGDGGGDDGRGFFDHPLAPFAIASGAVGVAGLVTWGIMGSQASSRHDDLAAECGGRCPPDRQDEVDSGRTESTVSVIGLVVGVLGVAGAGALTTLILLDDDGDGAVQAGRVRILPGARGADAGGLSLSGGF